MDDRDRINKDATGDRQVRHEDEFKIAGNARKKGEDPSPAERDRGERSEADPAGEEDRRA